MKNKTSYILGIIFLLTGIYLSIFKHAPHYFTFFSIGAFLILLTAYNSISKKPLFENWKTKNHIFFWITMIVLSIIIDLIGRQLGYWTYQYTNFYDEILKYVFEWAVPMTYIMIAFLLGATLFKKPNSIKAKFLSLIIFVTITGFITEFFNHFANSWIILKMPITSYSIHGYFIVFQTIGYWLMAIITLNVYKISARIK